MLLCCLPACQRAGIYLSWGHLADCFSLTQVIGRQADHSVRHAKASISLTLRHVRVTEATRNLKTSADNSVAMWRIRLLERFRLYHSQSWFWITI